MIYFLLPSWHGQNESDNEDDQGDSEKVEASDYDYLMTMQMWNLTKERKEKLLQQRDQKKHELTVLRGKTPKVGLRQGV